MAVPPYKPNASSLFGEEPDDDSFWLKLMAECLENPVTKLPTGRQLLVLGDNDAEKTLLITKLQGGGSSTEVNFTKGNGLEYRYLSVKDEYCDGQTKLGVWILDGDPFYKPLLKYALADGSSLADTTVLLVASMTRPWDIMDTISTWTGILREHIESLDIPDSELERAKGRVLERFREYVEPGLSIYGSLAADNTRELEVNVGVELVVVVSRTEYMRELQTEFGYEEEHFDYIQLSLREFCLSRGAALFYVSVKEDKNCDLLLKYVLHRIYSFPFRLPAVLVERDSILVPAGWDTKNKIRFLSETLTTIPSSTPYGEVVFRPARLADTKNSAPEIVARRNQEFLAEMQAALEQQDRTPDASSKDHNGTSGSSSLTTATVVQRNVARRMTRAQAGGRSPQKKMEAKLVSGEGDNTLSNFFHSLLNRRTSAPVDRPVGFTGNRTLTPKGAHSEHHRLTRNISTTESSGGDGGRNLHGISELQNDSSSAANLPSRSRKSSEGSDSSEDGTAAAPQSRLKGSVCGESLEEQQDEEEATRQLPEYFLSNPGGGLGAAPDDCCSFQRREVPAYDDDDEDMDDQFGPPLDRVRSSFNPPLKLLLEKGGGGAASEGGSHPRHPGMTNGSGLENGSATEFEMANSPFAAASCQAKPDAVMSSCSTASSSTMPFKTNSCSHDQNSMDG